MEISEDVRQYAAAQGNSEEETVEKGMEEKSREFVEKVQRFTGRLDVNRF